MCECQIRRVPVVENDVLVGIITIGDLANNQNVSSKEVSNTVEQICNCNQNSGMIYSFNQEPGRQAFK